MPLFPSIITQFMGHSSNLTHKTQAPTHRAPTFSHPRGIKIMNNKHRERGRRGQAMLLHRRGFQVMMMLFGGISKCKRTIRESCTKSDGQGSGEQVIQG